MNQQFDIIVIGDSKNGNEALKTLAAADKTIKLAFISRTFKTKTTHDFLNVEYIKDEVVFTDYKNRLFGCYTKSGNRLYCTHLIVATGVRYEPFLVNNKQIPCVFNTTDDISKLAKMQPALVIGTDDTAIKLALAVAKKYKQVYFCSKDLSLNASATNIKKLNDHPKIVVLPNTSITRTFSKDGVLEAVELDTYSKVTCSAIFIKTAATPESEFISDKLIAKTNTGCLIISNICESTIVPKCFAIGNCAEKNTKKMNVAMCETILEDFRRNTNANT